MIKKSIAVLMMAAVVAVAGLFAGCESGGGSSGGSGSGDSGSGKFAGTWALYSGSVSGNPTWFAHFKQDGAFNISDNADGSRVRVSGTYTVSGNKLVGPFKNPGVGEGRVEATISGDIMNLDFIEYWHTPNKVVPYKGKKR